MRSEDKANIELECVDEVKEYYYGDLASTLLLKTNCGYCGGEEEVELTYKDVCKLKKYMEDNNFMHTLGWYKEGAV